MMTAIEQTANANMMMSMSTTTPSLLESTHSSLLNVLPSRPSLMEKKGSSPSAASPKSLIDAKLNLLMKLVERVRKLDQVSVKTIPYLSKSGMIVEIPGPWSIRLSGTSTPTHHPERVIEQRGDEDDEGDEDGDNDDDDLPQDEEEDAETLAALAQLDRKKFVVRNEFGHVRIQPLIEAMENVPYGSLPERLAAQIEIGGHCVLSKKDFELCLERRWGQPHPLSGKFHPIAGTTIPETTLLFYTPRNEQELEMVWKIVQASYEWALSDQK